MLCYYATFQVQKNTFSASNLINLTHIPKWLRKSAKSLLYKLKKAQKFRVNSEFLSRVGSLPTRLKPQKWLCLANIFLAPPPRRFAALISVSVLLFGSCHLVLSLFVSSTNFIQIVRRQCCLVLAHLDVVECRPCLPPTSAYFDVCHSAYSRW